MTKNLPFTTDTLVNHPPFANLEPAVRDQFLDLLERGYLNEKGALKRPSNGFILFRNQFAATQLGSTNTSDALKQSDISTRTKASWDNLPAGEKAHYNQLYKAEKKALQDLFPDYKYQPIPLSIWNTLKIEGQKNFWFDSVARMAYKMVHKDSTWAGSLTVEMWLQTPGNNNPTFIDIAKYREACAPSKALHAPKGPKAEAHLTPDAVEPVRAGHPYASARPKRGAGSQAADRPRYETHINMLKVMLWPLGPPSVASPGRRLVLAFVQPQELLKRVYVEEEIPLDTPGEIVNELLVGQEEISGASDVIILRDFTNPPFQAETPESCSISTTATQLLSECQVITDALTASTPSDTHSSSQEDASSSKSLSPDTPTGSIQLGLPSPTVLHKPTSLAHEEYSYDGSPQIFTAPTPPPLGSLVERTDFQAARNQVPSVPASGVPAQPQPMHFATSNDAGLTAPKTQTLDARILAPAAQNLPVIGPQPFTVAGKSTTTARGDEVVYYGEELPVRSGIWESGSWDNANANNGQTQGLLSHNLENLTYEFGPTPLQASQTLSEPAGASGPQVDAFGEFGVDILLNGSFYHPHGCLGLSGGY